MWKLTDGKLVHTTDTSRVKFRTNVSKAIIDKLNVMAIEHNSYPNYLIESGLQNVLADGVIHFNKESRPKDRIQYKTTYDRELLNSVKDLAKKHNMYINDVLEYSVNFIDLENIKKSSYKHRIE
ncbi:rRNA methyltransferase [Halalkalibacter alkalisediminis]|uniref:rRNA methyltransferase n=1 Tax=Halalkalibacter alkalisediminis TaxID=935616 RepID=A0ABV6NJ21_9BACI|nr:rRNA methyltransferase [Halalkalibacter alkalisediminis]